jgi:DNA-binding transcriptional ArsR family regulator
VLPVTRQAVSKHLSSLADAGLVERSRVGREVRWEFSPDGLADVVSWVESVGSEWDRRLQRLKRELG